jgi:hypothetical protein
VEQARLELHISFDKMYVQTRKYYIYLSIIRWPITVEILKKNYVITCPDKILRYISLAQT